MAAYGTPIESPVESTSKPGDDTSYASCSILVLGDGNLSWSLAMAKRLSDSDYEARLLCTTYETFEELCGKYGSELIIATVRELCLLGAQVRHGVDATSLGGHLEPDRIFDRIVFNFPHWGGKGQIQRNRRLLGSFFKSAVQFLENDAGEVHVSLAQGQGGTPMDKDLGATANTWRVVEHAAGAGLICAAVMPFTPPEGYRCTGRRSTDLRFWLGGALLHIFVRGDREGAVSLYPPSYCLDMSFWVLDEAAFCHQDILDILDKVNTARAGGAIESADLINSFRATPRDEQVATRELLSMTYRITYRTFVGALAREDAIAAHEAAREALEKYAPINVRTKPCRPPGTKGCPPLSSGDPVGGSGSGDSEA